MKTRRQKILEDRKSISRRNSSLVNGGVISELIPIDLFIEILARLPAKSIARCRCVSKLWGSIILRQDFTDLVLTRSATTGPQLLFATERDNGEVSFYTSPQPQNPNEKSSHIVANHHMNFAFVNDDDYSSEIHVLVHGLICLKGIRILKGRRYTVLVICNPSTGQSLTSPRVKTRRIDVMSFFGYDPIDKQFKLLSMTRSKLARESLTEEHQILTLGNGKLSWRMIECSIPHYPLSSGICINDVLYYTARGKSFEGKAMIACFDIRSEKFKFIALEAKAVRGMLVNYKGKLATLRSNNRCSMIFENSESFELCVLEDAEKHEWSTHTYVIPPLPIDIVSPSGICIVGVTRTGEIVLSPRFRSDRFYLFYCNLERNTMREVEIQGIHVSKHQEVHTFIDHVEDVKLGGLFKGS